MREAIDSHPGKENEKKAFLGLWSWWRIDLALRNMGKQETFLDEAGGSLRLVLMMKGRERDPSSSIDDFC